MGWIVPAKAVQTLCGIAMGAVSHNERNDRDIDEEVWWVIRVDPENPDQRPEFITSHGDTNEMILATP